jgi:hypothetical protein
MVYAMSQQYFYRSGHKEELAWIDLPRVCQFDCPNWVGVPMQYIELWWAPICILLWAPFITGGSIKEIQRMLMVFTVFLVSKPMVHLGIMYKYMSTVFCSRMFQKWVFDVLPLFLPIAFSSLWR